jgi:hypothetical protein
VNDELGKEEVVKRGERGSSGGGAGKGEKGREKGRENMG